MKSTEEIWYALNNKFKDNDGSVVFSLFLDYDMACDCYAAFNADLILSCEDKAMWEAEHRINTEQKYIIIIRNCINRIMRFDLINEEFESYQRTFPKFVCYLWAYDDEFDAVIEKLYKNKDRDVALKLVKRVIDKFNFTEENDIWRENYEQEYGEITSIF